MENKKFSIKARIKSFRYAFAGIVTLIKNEHNARIHLCVTVCVLTAGIGFDISVTEWIFVIFAIGFVLSAEAVNSAVEYLADFVSPGKNEQIKWAKDVAAAAVLIAAITAVFIGLIIFVPRVCFLFPV